MSSSQPLPPYSYRLQLEPRQFMDALRDPKAFLAAGWPAGTPTVLEVRHDAGPTATVVVNRDQDSVFFEAWKDDSFSEPCYNLLDALQCAQDLLEPAADTTSPNASVR